ncbi:hypothetical protein imdm_216 [gamma proteobacterium IMCC2047]|nr:hypothetical protein imdm_216 [gamma proteobacterium IMCC2047]
MKKPALCRLFFAHRLYYCWLHSSDYDFSLKKNYHKNQ